MNGDNEKITQRLVRDTKRARGRTTLGRLESLQREQARWRKRATFARNKLAGLAAEIESIATELAEAQFEKELNEQGADTKT